MKMYLKKEHISIMENLSYCDSFSDPIYAHNHISFQLGNTGLFFRINLHTGEKSWVAYNERDIYRDMWGKAVGHKPTYYTFEDVFSSVLHPQHKEDLIFRINILKEDRVSLNDEEKSWKKTLESQLLNEKKVFRSGLFKLKSLLRMLKI